MNSTLYKVLLNLRDRIIPNLGNPISVLVQNEVYDYTDKDPNLGNSIIGNTARIGTRTQQDPRYPLRTFQNHIAYMRATGRLV